MPAISRVETLGSVWLLDDDNHRYCRMPRQEGPREDGDWPDPTGGPLEDLTWHAMTSWRISLTGVPLMVNGVPSIHRGSSMPLLVIEVDPADDGRKVVAPNAGPVTRIG